MKGKKEEAEAQINKMYDMNSSCPSCWLHEEDSKGEAGKGASAAETSEKALLVPKSTIKIDQEKVEGPVATASFWDLFGAEYR